MKKSVNATVLGSFIVGGIALSLAAILIFGGSGMFHSNPRFVVFFPGSIQGLGAGSTVSYHGAKVGIVRDVEVVFEKDSKSLYIPVIIELERNRIKGLSGPLQSFEDRQRGVLELGMRAQLVMESFVTGQKQVALDLQPETEGRMTNRPSNFPEIPTIPSAFEQLSAKLQNLPIERITELLEKTLAGVERLVNSPQSTEGMDSALQMLKEGRELAVTLRSQVGPLAQHADKLISAMLVRVEATKTEELARDFQKTLVRTEKVLNDMDQLMGEGAPVNQALGDFSAASRELKGLLEYLRRHPEALVQGKKPSGGS